MAADASRADEAATEALGARLSRAAVNEPNPGLGLLLARQAVAISDNPTTQGALLNTLMNAQGRLQGLAKAEAGPTDWAFDHAFTPDGRTLMHIVMHGVERGEVHLVDTTTGVSRYGALGRVEGLDTDTYSSGLIDGGRVAVVGFSDTGLLPIEVATGEPAGPRQQVPGAKGDGWASAPDGGRAAGDHVSHRARRAHPGLGARGAGAHLAPTRSALGRPAVRAHPAGGR